MAKIKKLFTIGYEQTPPKSVLDELERAGVKLLVDVRAIAASRRPGFSKNQLAAGLDERGISYLHLRGLDQDVSVVVWGEFGRTPRINPEGGRDHWPGVSCALLAGGGMRTGQVIGSTALEGVRNGAPSSI